MTYKAHHVNGRNRRFLPHRWFWATAIVITVVGCDNPLQTQDPDIVLPETLEGAEAIPTLVQGAISDFSLAYMGAPIGGGSTEGIAAAVGLFSDEFVHSGTFNTRSDIETRSIDLRNGQLTTLFRNLQRARRAAERTYLFIEDNGDDPASDSRVAQMLNLAGYAYIFAAENFCSGVPFSRSNPDGTFEFGEQLTTAETYDLAIERFDAALLNLQTSDNPAREYLTSLGRARVLLNQGDFDGAASAAAAVPTDFRFQLEHSINTGLQENGVHNLNTVFERWSVANSEGVNGLEFLGPGGTLDVRVPWERTGGGTDVGFDRQTEQYDLLKYPGRDKSSTLASGIEARLIEAEAALQNGDDAGWLLLLNDLRAEVADLFTRDQLDALRDRLGISGTDVRLDPLADPGSFDARVDLHFLERAFWLFAEGHRLSDLRRLVRQYGRDVESVYPTGDYFKGGVYGSDVVFLIPFDEENNPNFTSCLDSSP